MKDKWLQMNKKGREQAGRLAGTAARSFSRKGYLETTMEDIASAAGISKGGMYHYFKSKTEILFFILSRYMDRVLQDLEEDLTSIDEDDEKLRFVISRHIRLYVENRDEAKVLLHDAHCLPKKYLRIIVEKERIYFDKVASILPGALGRPVSKERMTVLTFMLFGMCNWIYSWYDPKGEVPAATLSEIIYGIFRNGIKGL